MTPAAGASMRSHIVAVASELFYRHGVKSVGVDRIVAEAGIAKATLYSHFPSKEKLVVAYLRGRHERVMASIEAGREEDEADPRARILRHFEMLRDKAGTQAFRGCAFLLAVAENEESDAIKQQVVAHKQAIFDSFLRELPPGLPARDELARQLALLYDGALAHIMIYRGAEPAMTAAACAAVLLDSCLR